MRTKPSDSRIDFIRRMFSSQKPTNLVDQNFREDDSISNTLGTSPIFSSKPSEGGSGHKVSAIDYIHENVFPFLDIEHARDLIQNSPLLLKYKLLLNDYFETKELLSRAQNDDQKFLAEKELATYKRDVRNFTLDHFEDMVKEGKYSVMSDEEKVEFERNEDRRLYEKKLDKEARKNTGLDLDQILQQLGL